MKRVKNCAVCHNMMVLDFEQQKKDGICPHCGTTFQYRLLGRAMCEFISACFPAYDDDFVPAKAG